MTSILTAPSCFPSHCRTDYVAKAVDRQVVLLYLVCGILGCDFNFAIDFTALLLFLFILFLFVVVFVACACMARILFARALCRRSHRFGIGIGIQFNFYGCLVPYGNASFWLLFLFLLLLLLLSFSFFRLFWCCKCDCIFNGRS